MRRHCLDMTAWNTPFSSDAVWARSMFAGKCLCFVLSAILLWTLISPRAAAQVAAEPLQTPQDSPRRLQPKRRMLWLA